MTDKEKLWVKALIDAKEILEKYNCSYFLDTGTLLGAIREHKFIEWDNDIDLGVVNFPLDQKKTWQISNDFYKKGYNVTSVIDDINISLNGTKLDLGIKFYAHIEQSYRTSLGKVLGNRLCSSIALYSSDTFVYKRGYKKFISLSLIANVCYEFRKIIPLKVKDSLNRKANVSMSPIEIEESLLTNFIDYNFYDNFFKVPEKFENYLSLRYGKDWNIPKRNYDYTKDDQSIKYIKS